jgi:hypothetical protein
MATAKIHSLAFNPNIVSHAVMHKTATAANGSVTIQIAAAPAARRISASTVLIQFAENNGNRVAPKLVIMSMFK